MLPLSAILPLFWPGQSYGTEHDDAAGNGIIVNWSKANSLPEPSVKEVRDREPEAEAILAKRAEAERVGDEITQAMVARVSGTATVEQEATLTDATRLISEATAEEEAARERV